MQKRRKRMARIEELIWSTIKGFASMGGESGGV